MNRLFCQVCFMLSILLSVPSAQVFLDCSKLKLLDSNKGLYECVEFGSLYSGKRVKIGSEVRRLIFVDHISAAWNEVEKVEFEGDWGATYHYIKFEASFKNGKLDGPAFVNWEPQPYNADAYPQLYYRDGMFKFSESNHFFYKTPPHYVDLYENGVLKRETSYYESGELWWTVENKKGKRVGRFVSYHKSGEIEAEVEYKNGAEEGLKTWYNTDGSVEYYDVYEKGKFIEKRCPDGRRGNQMMKC